MLEDVNQFRLEQQLDFEEQIAMMKEEALEEEVLFSSDEFDIFGGRIEDKTKISVLDNKKHREIKKSKFRLLDINKGTTNEQYIESLKSTITHLESAFQKAEIEVKLDTFYASIGVLNNQKYAILYLNPKHALDTLKEQEKINLYHIKLKEKTRAIALTNIIYYDNHNLTLPIRNERSR